MISRTAEYALRAMVHLAAHTEQIEAQTLNRIAGATLVPESYLSKVLQQLARGGLIASQRGTGGGFRLARSAREITIYDVVEVVDPLPRIRECPLGLEAHIELCPLHRRLDDAAAQVEKAFRATTLAELVQSTDPLCQNESA